MNNDERKRRSIRLPGYDYRDGGVYFVTICTKKKEHLFGKIRNGMMGLNEYGCVVADCWQSIPTHFPGVELDAFIIMPNHIHGLLYVDDQSCRGMACHAPTQRKFGKPIASSLPTIIGSFKSAVTKRINSLRDEPGAPVWQRNYYERIVRNHDETIRIRRYIHHNPHQWDRNDDNEFPDFL